MKELTLEKKLQIGNYFKDGLKAKDIAPLYGITETNVYTVIDMLRRQGVVIPFKNIKRKKTELLPTVNEVKKMVGVGTSPKAEQIDWEKAVKESMKIEREKSEKEHVLIENLLKVKDITLKQWLKAKTVNLLIAILS